MKSQIEILNRIDKLTVEMQNINTNLQTGNLFIWVDSKKKLLSHADEISHLCWVLGEDVPKHVLDLM